MRNLQCNRRCLSKLMALPVAAALLLASAAHTSGDARKAAQERESETASRGPEKFLFIWAGDQARLAPDFLAVVDFDEASPTYGSVITTVPVPGAGASGNEPHHVGLSSNKRVLACGGLLSVLRGQKEI